jgi:ariadne-1
VEDLSELLEMPIEPDTISALRQKMTDKTVRVELTWPLDVMS